MKKFLSLAIVALIALCCAGQVRAQHNYGVIGGVSFSRISTKEFNRGTMTQYHAGITYRARLPLGFSIQPSLIYHVKGAKTYLGPFDVDATLGYLELPVSFQWGPDLILFRPFVDVTPFVGYGLNNNFWSGVTGDVANVWDGLSRWEYGVGTGIGMDIWRFQLIARYNWNLENISRNSTISDIAQTFKDGANLGGVTLSLAFMF